MLSFIIPKNFNNKKDFDSEERIQIWDNNKMEQIFKEMEKSPISQNEKIIINLEKASLSLLDENNVNFTIQNTFKIGFEHSLPNNKKEFENILSIIPVGKEKEDESKLRKKYLSDLELNENFKYCLEILFGKNNNIFDFELHKYKDVDHFSGLKKMLYILTSTFSYKFIFNAIGKINIIILNIPNRLFDYIYYIKNWTKLFYSMIEAVYPEIKKKRKKKNNEQKSNYKVNNNEKEDENLDENDINTSIEVPIKGVEKTIMTIKFPLIYITLTKDRKDFQHFIFFNSVIEMLKNANNEKLLRFKVKDLHWKVNDSKCKNLIIKNKKYPSNYILEFQMILDNSYLLKESEKILHKMIIQMELCDIVYLAKYVNEFTLFLDINQMCLNENPKKENLYKILTQKSEASEVIYSILKNVAIIVPESSISSNYIKVNFDYVSVQVKNDFNKIKIMPIDKENLYIINKKSLFGTYTEEINKENTFITDLKNNEELKEYLFKMTNTFCECKGVTVKLVVNKQEKKIIKNIENIKSNINIPVKDEISKIYEYYWKLNKNKFSIVPMKMKMNIDIKSEKNETYLSMGDINAIERFIDNNFDEKSPLYSEEDAIFNTMFLNAKFDSSSKASINLFKVFNEFFENSKPIEKIGNKLPGYDNEITYDTDFD